MITVCESHRSSDWNHSSRDFRTFGNPLPVGFVAHALCALVFGSYLASWRSVGSPLIISALALGLATPCSIIACIFCMVINDTFFACVFIALGGLWTMFGVAYLPLSGLLGYYGASPELIVAQQDSIAIIMIWFGILAIILSGIAIRRNVCFVVIFLSAAIGILVLSSTYFKHEVTVSKTSKAAGYLFIISGIASAYFAISGLLAAERFWIQLPLGVYAADPRRLNDAEKAIISGEAWNKPTHNDVEKSAANGQAINGYANGAPKTA